MPGTPSGRGCDGCRRQKKKCDQAKPTCGRCKRVGVPCVGNGVKRWKFHSFQNDDQSLIKRRPSNEQTQLSSSLVHILQTEDARFDIRAFGGKLIPEIVAQIGCSPALDSCVNAMVSLYKSHRCQESRIDALTRYGEALTATRNAILDPKEKIIMKMQVVSIMFVCHYWVDRKSIEQHREVISVLFREAVMKNQLDDLGDYMVGLSQLAVMASFLNPQFELGPWFWEACETIGTPRPVKYHQGSFLSLESGTMGELSILMRSPKKNLRQLRCIYDVMQFEMPKVRQLLALATISTAAPNAPAMSTRVCSSYRVAYGILLAMTAVIGHTLRIWDTDLTLVGNSHDCVDECIALVEQCESARPYGANFVPDFLTMVWAAATDGYRNDEMAEYLVDYEKDSIGADFMGQAMSIRERLFAMEARETAKEVKLVLDPALESLVKRPVVSVQEIQPAVSECIIL
ncbi:hypothetical protein FOQG_14927 [Fusarium oxysporum f. sp. raphani 54005]|uniref:Zn(2)-C6 fungal-type domain-containing protein n=1 Tax=Fusarium oxysporum f. sp. raphani 54005 TaxID=1089458 RepID=X0CD35_FUSOX|nr:hypothetical protein FOQG_14927 [Fusarium oxysporum f. sp. raphani 54005]